MARMLVSLSRLVRADGGQDLIEYALLVGLVALLAVVGVGSLGTTINSVFWQTIAAQSF